MNLCSLIISYFNRANDIRDMNRESKCKIFEIIKKIITEIITNFFFYRGSKPKKNEIINSTLRLDYGSL